MRKTLPVFLLLGIFCSPYPDAHLRLSRSPGLCLEARRTKRLS